MATGFPQVCVAVHVASAVPDPSVTLRCPRSLGGLPHFDFWTFRRCLCHPFSFTTWLPTLFASPCLMPLLMSPVVKVPLLACAQRPRCLKGLEKATLHLACWCRRNPILSSALPCKDRLVRVNSESTNCCSQTVWILHGHHSFAFCFVHPLSPSKRRKT